MLFGHESGYTISIVLLPVLHPKGCTDLADQAWLTIDRHQFCMPSLLPERMDHQIFGVAAACCTVMHADAHKSTAAAAIGSAKP